jgi:uncharacterized membrane protein YgdD (TMEM256/DUF423 family)
MAAAPLLTVAGLAGAAGVMLGAFGAHGLKTRLGPDGLETWQTAVTYHLVHALALLAIGVWSRAAALSGHQPPGTLEAAGWTLAVGILLFSGSLYVLALGGPRWLGPVTPLGGAAFIAGWLLLAWSALRGGAG